MALALLAVIWLLALASAYFFAAHDWLPAGAAAEAAGIDAQLRRSFLLIGTIFIGVHGMLGLFIFRYRARAGATAEYRAGSTRAEWTWTAAVTVLLFALNFAGMHLWAASRRPAAAGALTVEATGVQFAWYFRYAGPDGRFGRTDSKQVDASLGNPLGLDPADSSGADDIVSAELVLPLGREADVRLRAQDVIHSFFVPAFRIKQDAVPGLATATHFRTTQLGEYELACAELCGIGHHRMKARVRVVPEAEYYAWLAQKSAEREGTR